MDKNNIIVGTSLNVLTNLESSNAFSESLLSFKKVDGAALGIEAAITDFEQKLSVYKELVRVADKMQETQQLATLDNSRDQLVIGIEELVNAYKRFPDVEKHEAANSIDILLNMYNRQIERLSYTAETEAIEKVLIDVKQEPYASQSTLLNLDEWFEKLASANQKFNEIFVSRDTKNATHEKGATRKARVETQETFTELCDLINSHVHISGITLYKTLVDEINQIISRAKSDHKHAQPHKK